MMVEVDLPKVNNMYTTQWIYDEVVEWKKHLSTEQARRQLNWNGGGGMDSQYKLLSELLSDQAAFITSLKTSLANYWGALPPCPPPVSTGLRLAEGQ